MSFGYMGKILRVDLGSRRICIEEPSDVFYRTFVGGRNIIAYYDSSEKRLLTSRQPLQVVHNASDAYYR